MRPRLQHIITSDIYPGRITGYSRMVHSPNCLVHSPNYPRERPVIWRGFLVCCVVVQGWFKPFEACRGTGRSLVMLPGMAGHVHTWGSVGPGSMPPMPIHATGLEASSKHTPAQMCRKGVRKGAWGFEWALASGGSADRHRVGGRCGGKGQGMQVR